MPAMDIASIVIWAFFAITALIAVAIAILIPLVFTLNCLVTIKSVFYND